MSDQDKKIQTNQNNSSEKKDEELKVEKKKSPRLPSVSSPLNGGVLTAAAGEDTSGKHKEKDKKTKEPARRSVRRSVSEGGSQMLKNENDGGDKQTVAKEEDEQKLGEGGKTTVVVKGKKKKKKEPFLRGGRGQVHIQSSYNNTLITVTDLNGAVLAWGSAGRQGFKGPKKATPYAAGAIVKSLSDKIKNFGIKEVDVFVKGVGPSREAAVRAFGSTGVGVVSIKDVTPIPHGGCRPKKPRRV